MSWALDPVFISKGDVQIRPYTEDDFDSISKALHDPDGFFAITWGILQKEDIIRMLRSNLLGLQNQKCNPFVYLVQGEVAGISRFLNIDSTQRCLEIGGTWVAPKWRRTFLNTHVKYMLLSYAFETIGAERVEFRVNENNFRSQRAVLRLGAVYEGRLRHRTHPTKSESAAVLCYSVIRPEWPTTRVQIEQLMSPTSSRSDLSTLL